MDKMPEEGKRRNEGNIYMRNSDKQSELLYQYDGSVCDLLFSLMELRWEFLFWGIK